MDKGELLRIKTKQKPLQVERTVQKDFSRPLYYPNAEYILTEHMDRKVPGLTEKKRFFR